ARQKLKYEGFIALNDELVHSFYTVGDEKRYKGYRILSIDGSDIRLPNSPEICREFGTHSSGMAMSSASILYDVMNHLTLDSQLGKCYANERTQAIMHLENLIRLEGGRLKRKTIVLFDRGYPSMHLLCFLQKHQIDFVIRCAAQAFIKPVIAFSHSDATDDILEIKLEELNKQNFLKLKPYFPDFKALDLRVIRLSRPKDKDLFLLTSLTHPEAFSTSDFEELYHKRWGVETQYNYLKTTMELENFATKTALGIRQEFYATILCANIYELIAEDAEEEYQAEQASKGKKDNTKINHRVAAGFVKNELIDLLYSDIPIETIYARVLQKIKQNRVVSKPGRSFERKVRHRRKFHQNNRTVS
ncbi:MAG: IS4 family transposase, partial [Bdellovibrionota bacterium]